jgi:hypothetical protein
VPFGTSNPEDRVFFIERRFMCLVKSGSIRNMAPRGPDDHDSDRRLNRTALAEDDDLRGQKSRHQSADLAEIPAVA